jgi:hypothetical protein
MAAAQAQAEAAARAQPPYGALWAPAAPAASAHPLSTEQRAAQAVEAEASRLITQRKRFLQHLTQHADRFRAHFGLAARGRAVAVEGVRAFHNREAARQGRAEARRLQALRANDEEEYLRLVAESKNERLGTLLGRTAELLENLGQKIKATQAAAAAAEGEGCEAAAAEGEAAGEAEAAEMGARAGAEALRAGRRRYAEAATSVATERIAAQPASLTGGALRSYQRVMDANVRTMLVVSALFYVAGFAFFWLPDKLMCERVQSLQFHALFHISSTVGPWYLIQHVCVCRLSCSSAPLLLAAAALPEWAIKGVVLE